MLSGELTCPPSFRIMALPSLQKSVDGIESQFATNVVGHTLLLVRLLPSLIKNADEKGKKARVVWVSSDLHNKADPKVGVNFETVNDEKAYSAWVWCGYLIGGLKDLEKETDLLLDLALAKQTDKRSSPTSFFPTTSPPPSLPNTPISLFLHATPDS